MNETVILAKANNVLVGAHPSLPDLQGFGRREMAVEPVGWPILPRPIELILRRSPTPGRTRVLLHLPGRRFGRLPEASRTSP